MLTFFTPTVIKRARTPLNFINISWRVRRESMKLRFCIKCIDNTANNLIIGLEKHWGMQRPKIFFIRINISLDQIFSKKIAGQGPMNFILIHNAGGSNNMFTYQVTCY